MASDNSDADRLRRQGYRVRKPGEYVKTTFLVQSATIKTFRKRIDELGYKVQDAVTEALDDWIEKHPVNQGKNSR